MKKLYFILFSFFLLISLNDLKAQNIDTLLSKSEEILEEGRIFSIKGIGMAFPMGEVSDVLSPKFSSEIGLQILLKNPRYFVYPALDYMNYQYDQKYDDPGYDYKTKNASAKLYIVTFSAGLIKQINKLRIFSSAGLGGGIINEPRATVNTAAHEINFENKSSFTGTLRLNTGLDYGKKTFKFFAEISYLLQTKRIEQSNLHTLAINVGTKTNLYRLAKSLKKLREQ